MTHRRLSFTAISVAIALFFARQVIAQVPEFDQNVAVSFYGKALDQEGAPVPDVAVDLLVLYMRDFSSGGDYLRRITDANGRLVVTHQQGYAIEIVRTEKEGYLLSPWAHPAFNFAPADASRRHKPDPENPVQFQMWKRRGRTEPQVAKSKGFRLRYDGTPLLVDLVKNKALRELEAGNDLTADLSIALTRKTFHAPNGALCHHWAASVEAVNGGVAAPKDDDAFMFLAPAMGYSKSLGFESRKDATAATRQTAVFVAGREGKLFASVWLKFVTDSDGDHAGLYIESHFNTDGSRLLEFDYWQQHKGPLEGIDLHQLVPRFHSRPRPDSEESLAPLRPPTSRPADRGSREPGPSTKTSR